MNHNKDKLSVGLSSKLTSETSEEALNNMLANLADEITPERDLWLGIERAISQKSQHSIERQAKSKFVPVAWAASFVAAIVLSWLTFTPLMQQETQNIVRQENSVNPVATKQIVTFMQANFQQQKEAMLVSFGQPNLSQLSEAMQKELNQLAAARESIRQALLKDQNDIDLLNLLDFTQQQELKLISQLYQQYQVI